MAEPFEITAFYKNQECTYEATFQTVGFSYRIEVMAGSVPVIFEPDEERNFRALVPDAGAATVKTAPDALLLQAIALALEKAFR